MFLDQSPIGRSGRSNPVTYLKAFDEIRTDLRGHPRGQAAQRRRRAMFSFNVEGGRCNACKGDGFLTIDMQFLPDVMVRCPECRGAALSPRDPGDHLPGQEHRRVLDLTAREAFGSSATGPRVQARLRPLLDIGLDYLRLGQPASTLSGGEAQRSSWRVFWRSSTAALNPGGGTSHTRFSSSTSRPPACTRSTCCELLDALNSLVDRGHSVIVIEHSPEVMVCRRLDHRPGPRRGDDGGRIVAQGTPEAVAQSGTLTGQVLAGRLTT